MSFSVAMSFEILCLITIIPYWRSTARSFSAQPKLGAQSGLDRKTRAGETQPVNDSALQLTPSYPCHPAVLPNRELLRSYAFLLSLLSTTESNWRMVSSNSFPEFSKILRHSAASERKPLVN